MLTFIIAVLLLLISLLAISLHKTYSIHPLIELKRRARGHDHVAATLYPVAAHGPSLKVLLWSLIVLPLAGSFVLLTQVAPAVLVWLLLSFCLVFAFGWAPSAKVSSLSVRLSVLSAPLLHWLLTKIGAPLNKLYDRFTKHRPRRHTRLYQHDDLLDLFDRQKHQSDSRIPAETLDMLGHMLTFGTRRVRECMVPQAKVRSVKAEELVGPVLLKDLHETGHRRFPVYDGQLNQLVGLLDLDVVTDLKHTGSVRSAMDPHVMYLHEDHPLEQVIDAFYKTGASLYMVLDNAGDVVGLITVEDVLTLLLGYRIHGDFDQYDSRLAVAGYQQPVSPEEK